MTRRTSAPEDIPVSEGHPTPLSTAPASRRAGTVVAVGLALVLYWIYGARPLVAEPGQWADDGLYLRQAEAIVRWVHGDAPQWLGPYDPVLLSKAPFFAIWMSLLHLARIPLRIAEFGLLLVLPWLFRRAVRPMLDLRGGLFALTMVILVGLPFLPQDQRLLRSALQAGLASGCLISTVGLILRGRCQGGELYRWAGLTGFFFAVSYLNREETIWLLPGVICGLGAVAAGAWVRREWRTAARAWLCAFGVFAIPVGLVCLLNYQAYGIAITTTRRAPAFTRAHQVMTSLEPETREPHVPIRTATRLKAYALSPTFARLQSYLESPAVDSIARNAGHLALNERSPDTREFFVSNFEFVLRNAAFEAGARTAPAAEAMFTEIEHELSAAVAAGKISAGNHGPAVMAAPGPGDHLRILRQTIVSIQKLYSLEAMSFPAPGRSSGEPADLQRMANLTGMNLAPTQEIAPTQLPDSGVRFQRALFRVFTACEMVAYAVGTLTVLGFAAFTALRHYTDPSYWERTLAGLVLFGSVLAFSLSMAVVHVLGFPILRWAVPYNALGYIPLSVLAAFGLGLLGAWWRQRRRAAP
jgi:hypothetical protein